MNAIEVSHLRRIYKVTVGVVRRSIKEVVAVDDISFDVAQGELFGLVGPNGAGKTTTVKMLATLLLPDEGTARILGSDVVHEAETVRKHIGFIFGGERGLYWRLSGIDNLRYFADEPTIGLDPVGAREFREVIRNLQSENKTILLTTHYMFEADSLCQRVGVINHGRIIALDTPEALKRHAIDLTVIEVEMYGVAPEVIERVRAQPFVDSVAVENRDQKQVLQVHSLQGAETVPTLMETLDGVRVGRVQVREPTLEDAYIRLVGGDG